jgi:ATP-dependent Lon protease
VDGTEDLGLFPLDLVLLPGEVVPLHLFEPRYRQLYADCVLEDRPFVIVRAGPTGTADIGCSARFEDLIRRFDDGRLNVTVAGEAPVEVIEETEGHLYFSAQVRRLEDRPSAPEPALVEEVLTRYRTLAGLAPDARPKVPEGVPLSYGLAGTLELGPGPKQLLLESRDEAERLGMLARILVAAEGEVRHARMAAQRAQTNGKVTAP